MSLRNAAPEGSLRGDPRGSGFNSGDGLSLPDSIPEHIRARLITEGVRSLDDWTSLGEQRFRLFGITTRMALEIDELARKVSP